MALHRGWRVVVAAGRRSKQHEGACPVLCFPLAACAPRVMGTKVDREETTRTPVGPEAAPRPPHIMAKPPEQATEMSIFRGDVHWGILNNCELNNFHFQRHIHHQYSSRKRTDSNAAGLLTKSGRRIKREQVLTCSMRFLKQNSLISPSVFRRQRSKPNEFTTNTTALDTCS